MGNSILPEKSHDKAEEIGRRIAQARAIVGLMTSFDSSEHEQTTLQDAGSAVMRLMDEVTAMLSKSAASTVKA